jgi:hypothetical protein
MVNISSYLIPSIFSRTTQFAAWRFMVTIYLHTFGVCGYISPRLSVVQWYTGSGPNANLDDIYCSVSKSLVTKGTALVATHPGRRTRFLLAMPFSAAILLLALLSVISAAPTPTIPLPPGKDPFYTAPEGFENASPGEVLRVRIAPGNLTTLVANISQAYHILYRTTDSHYHASWAVTTLFLPLSNSTSDALLSYQIPYNSPNIDESPSWAYYAGQNSWNSDQFVDVEWALGRGWFVNVPDFEGPLAAFIAGPQEGHATLDSIRAVKSLSLGLASEARVALWGYSGGSLASEFAAEMQVQYAPELQISGIALGGLVDNVTDAIDRVNGAPFAGLIPVGLLGLTAQFPEVRAFVVDQLKDNGPYNKTTFLASLNSPLTEVFAIFANQTIWNYFRDGRDIMYNPLLAPLLHTEATLGSHGIPQVPLFIYKAIHDEIARIEGTDDFVERYCRYGANIWYQRNTEGEHLSEVVNGKPSATQFLQNVLDGRYEHDGCTVEDVSVNLISAAS